MEIKLISIMNDYFIHIRDDKNKRSQVIPLQFATFEYKEGCLFIGNIINKHSFIEVEISYNEHIELIKQRIEYLTINTVNNE